MDGWFWLGYRDVTREQTRYGNRWLYRLAGKRQTSGQGGHLAPASVPGDLMGWRCTSASLVEVVAEG